MKTRWIAGSAFLVLVAACSGSSKHRGGGGGGGGATSGGAGGSTSGAVLTSGALLRCDIGVGSGTQGLVTDFEETTAPTVVEQDGRFGYWYTDQGSGEVTLTAPVASDAPSGTHALHAVGSGIGGWGSVFGFTLRTNKDAAGCAYDASAYTGVRFRARGNTTLRFEAQTIATEPTSLGGTCTAKCFDNHGASVPLTDTFKPYTVWFSDLAQAGWGTAAALDLRALYVMQWKTLNAGDYDVWLDDIELINDIKKGDPDTIVLTVPAVPSLYPALAAGLNYWSWGASWGAPVMGTEDWVKPLSAKTLRLGGTYPDTSAADPFSVDVMAEGIAYAKRVGATPIIQVPVVAAADKSPATAENAAAIVKELNVTRGLGVTYFSVGNEPDLYVDQKVKPSTWTVTDYCSTFAAFADAMKAVDPTIKVIGPELSWKYQIGDSTNDWFTPFLRGCGNKADVLSIHRYPFDATQTKTAAAMDDGEQYRALLRRLRKAMNDAGLSSLPLAVTEANITWDDAPDRPVGDASPGTLPAALWLADNFGVSLEEGVFTTDYWSIREGWSLGMLDGDTPRPAYYALLLFGQNFGPERVAVQKSLMGISVYASRDSNAGRTTVILVNRDSVEHPLTLQVAGLEATIQPVQHTIPAMSITAVVLYDSGAPAIWEYGSAEVDKKAGPSRLR